MKRATTYRWEPPISFKEVLEREHERYQSRVKRIMGARKLIEALEPDLVRLRARSAHYDIEGNSGLVLDCREDRATGRAVNALFLDTGIFYGSGDRLIETLIEIGYHLERTTNLVHPRGAILRRPKTQLRVVARCTEGYAAHLEAREAA
ncbi:hypothetical protein AB4Y43_07090 [Paraburkholderia sp. BR10872]|uniref:hypothetical protein n=1 Tax=Paraburkholderia sp. BR10872 TaxID=3236989 RepID=UPI0034D27C1C